ncbi:MAG: MFS transporter, partial [Gemmatimonadetes bacterium]|nr:MFS transporter [Gemmatimonadota bacterium]
MNELLATPGLRAFLRVWIGLTVSTLGSTLTAFALGIWVFQETGSTTQYALVMFCAALPPLVLLPLAGPLIDRLPRRRLLVVCDLVAAAAVLALGLAGVTGGLSLPIACAVVAATSAATALQIPTWHATVTVLVPVEQLGRANGLNQLSQALAHVAAPLLAGVLVVRIGLAGIAALDLATFLVSLALLLATRIPDPADTGRRRANYVRDLPVGWRAIVAQPGLLALLGVFLAGTFFSEVASVLFTPFVLSFSTPEALGTILSLGGLGMLAGGAVMTVWGGPRRPALGATLFAAAAGIPILAAGFTTSTTALAAIVAAYFFFLPLLAGSSQVVWQKAIPAALQGRVFAT